MTTQSIVVVSIYHHKKDVVFKRKTLKNGLPHIEKATIKDDEFYVLVCKDKKGVFPTVYNRRGEMSMNLSVSGGNPSRVPTQLSKSAMNKAKESDGGKHKFPAGTPVRCVDGTMVA